MLWKQNGQRPYLKDAKMSCIEMFSALQKHTHTYQISYKPPALRAIATSSLPYFSSADALHEQNHRRAEPHCIEHTLLIHAQFTRNLWAHLIFKSSSMSLHVRRPSLSLWLIVSYPILLMKSTPWNHKYQTITLIVSVKMLTENLSLNKKHTQCYILE